MESFVENVFAPAKPDLWQHQIDVINFAEPKDAHLNTLRMGAGKTRTIIELWERWKAQFILVIAPLSVVDVNGWLRQIRIHGTKDYSVFLAKKGSVADRVKKAKKAMETAFVQNAYPFVLVINYEAAWRPAMATFLKSIKWDVATLDEIHRISAPDTKASQFCFSLRPQIVRKTGLSGTPMRNSPLDIFGQFRFLDPKLFGLNFHQFKQTYARTLGQVKRKELEELQMLRLNNMATEETHAEIKKLLDFFRDTPKQQLNNIILGYKNQEQLNEKFYRIAFRAGEVDLNLPPAMHEVRTFALSALAQKAYDDIDEKLVAQVKTGTITAPNALVETMRLQQITGGCVPINDGKGKEIVDDGKSRLLDELFEDADPSEPFVVFAWYTEDLLRIREAAERSKRGYFELSGKKKELALWQGSIGGEVLGAQIASGSEGVDATRARYCAVYSFRGSVAAYDQMLARTHRPGQTRPVTYYHLIASNSIDGKIYRSLRRRRELIDDILSLIVERNTDDDVLID
jgi:SNF2 family DNA or RNA helicase